MSKKPKTDSATGALRPMTECVHCGATHPRMTTIPLESDDAAWRAIAKEHATSCEWVKTRAGRRSPAGAKRKK